MALGVIINHEVHESKSNFQDLRNIRIILCPLRNIRIILCLFRNVRIILCSLRNIRIILCSFIEFELSKKLFDTFKMTLSGATTNQLFRRTVTV